MQAAVSAGLPSLFSDTHAASEQSFNTHKELQNIVEPHFSCDCWPMTFLGIMVGAAAVLKLYAIGTVLSVIAVIYGLADSVGGLMYSPDYRYINGLNHQTHGGLPSLDHLRRRSLTKNVGS